MKKINKILMPIMSVAALSASVIPLVACNETTYGVTVKQHAGIAITCDSSVAQGRDLVIQYETLDGYVVDKDNSEITINGSPISEGYVVSDKIITVLSSKITGSVVVNLNVKKAPAEYYDVICLEQSNVTITAETQAKVGVDFKFEVKFDDNYVYDPTNSYIQIGTEKKYGPAIVPGSNTIPAASITGNITISVKAKYVQNYYNVYTIKTGNVTINASQYALIDQPFYFNAQFDDGYVYDQENSYIQVQGGKTFEKPVLDATGSYTIAKADVTGDILIYIKAMPAQYKVNEPEINDNVRSFTVPSSATYGQDISGTVLIKNYCHIATADTTYTINGETKQLALTQIGTSCDYYFTISGSEIKGDISIKITAEYDTGVEITCGDYVTDAYLSKLTSGSPAYVYATLRDGYVLNSSKCTIILGQKTLTVGTDYVVGNDSITISTEAVNTYAKGADKSIAITLNGVEAIPLTYDDIVGDGHFRSDSTHAIKFAQSTPKAGENLVIDLSHHDATETEVWYGLDEGYKIKPADTKIYVNGTQITTGYIINDDRYINQIIISGKMIPENATIKIEVAADFIEPVKEGFEIYNNTEITTPSPLLLCTDIQKTGSTYTLGIIPRDAYYGEDNLTISVNLYDTFRKQGFDVDEDDITWDNVNGRWIVDITDYIEDHSGVSLIVKCTVNGVKPTADPVTVTGDLEDLDNKFSITAETPAYGKDLKYTYTLTNVTDDEIMIDTTQISATYTLGSGSPTAIPASAIKLVRNSDGGTITIDGDYVKYGYTIDLTVNVDAAWHIDPLTNLGGVKFTAKNDETVESITPSSWDGADYFDTTKDDPAAYVISNVIITPIKATWTPKVTKVSFRWDNTAEGVYKEEDITSYVTFADNKLTILPAAFLKLNSPTVGGSRVTNFYIHTEWSVE